MKKGMRRTGTWRTLAWAAISWRTKVAGGQGGWGGRRLGRVQHWEVEVEIPSGRLEIGPRGEVSWRPSLVLGLLLFMETKGNDESSVSW